MGLDGDANLLAFFGPAYTLARPVLGGQAAFSLLGVFGRNEASVDATLTGLNGGTVSGSTGESLTSYEAGRPFYAYVPYTLVHFPTLPKPALEGRTG